MPELLRAPRPPSTAAAACWRVSFTWRGRLVAELSAPPSGRALGQVLADRGWRASSGEPGEMELFPDHDVRLPLDIDAVSAEITRVLTTLRLDLGAPER